MRQLLQSSLPAFSKSTTGPRILEEIAEKKDQGLSGWISSIRAKAKAALEQDDDIEAETELEIERSRREDSILNEPESPPPTETFDLFERILQSNSKKRPIGFFQHNIETPFEKRQKMVSI